MPSTSTFEKLRDSLAGPPETYRRKQLHKVPDAKTVDRVSFILSRVEGKNVLELGASGRMHEEIKRVSTKVVGIDRESSADGTVIGFDLDGISAWVDSLGGSSLEPIIESRPDVIVAGEVIEHLSNPGNLLRELKHTFPGIPLIVTVPNAYCSQRQLESESIENVNIDHVAWHSPRTIRTLLERAGYEIKEFMWYGGRPKFAEGMIVVAQ